jgi:outer membrane receptor protein involved in Fe transport
VFLQDEQRLGENLILTGAIRLDYNSITPFTVSPRLAGVWQFSDDQFLRLAAGQAFRKPSFFETSLHLKNVRTQPGFEELSDFMRESLGNPDLENESVTALETSYHGRFLDSRLSVVADAFYNRYRNTVNFSANFVMNNLGIPDLARSEAEYNNDGLEADSLGGSLSITYRVLESLRINANYTFRHSWYIQDFPGDSMSFAVSAGDRVAWEPAHRFNLSLYGLARRGIRAGINLHAASSSDWVMVQAGLLGYPTRIHTPASCALNAFAGWQLTSTAGQLELGVRAFNLLNATYADITRKTSPDSKPMGGFQLSRRIFLFLRGSL